MVVIIMWLQVLPVVAMGHLSVGTNFNTAHKVARSALLADHNHRYSTTPGPVLLALRCVHVSAHRRDKETGRRLRLLSRADVVDTALLLQRLTFRLLVWIVAHLMVLNIVFGSGGSMRMID